jgi:hypothetical protein
MDFEYNYSNNNYSNEMHIGGNQSFVIFKNNVLHNYASAQGCNPGGNVARYCPHMNIIEWGSNNAIQGDVTIQFNTAWVDTAINGGEGFQTYLNPGSFGNIYIENNTFPRSNCNCISSIVNGPNRQTTIAGAAVLGANYFDVIGMNSAFSVGWRGVGAVLSPNNINMINGAIVVP